MQKNKGNPAESARLNLLIEALNITKAAFGEKLGYSKTAISQMVSGVRSISANFEYRLATHYPNANMDWIRTGKGMMFTSTRDANGNEIPNSKHTPEEFERILKERDEARREAMELQTVVEYLLKKQSKSS